MSDSPSPFENIHWLVKTVEEQRQRIAELEKERDAWKECAHGLQLALLGSAPSRLLDIPYSSARQALLAFDKLIEKWSPGSWHADTLEWLCNDAGGHGVRCQNWADIYKRVVLI